MTEQLQFPTDSTAVHHAEPTSVIHLDEHTRQIGRAGVADARAILAACAPTVLDADTEISGRNDTLRTVVESAPGGKQDERQCRHLEEGPIDVAEVELSAAA